MSQTTISIDFTNTRQTNVKTILPRWCLLKLQKLDIYDTIRQYIEAISELCYQRYLKIHRLETTNDTFNQLWKRLNLKQICKMNDESDDISPQLLTMMENSFNQYREYLNESLSDLFDIGIIAFHKLLESDEYYKTSTMQLLNVDFVKEHNELLRKIATDEHEGIPNAIQCVIEHTTQSQYRLWRSKVCKYCIYIISVYHYQVFTHDIFLYTHIDIELFRA